MNNRWVSFVLWLIPIFFLVVDVGAAGSLSGASFWFFLAVISLLVARSTGVIGENIEQEEEPAQPRSGEEIGELERIIEPFLNVKSRKWEGGSVEFEGKLLDTPEHTVAWLEGFFDGKSLRPALLEGGHGSAKIVLVSGTRPQRSSDRPGRWLQVLLFVLAFITTTWVGAARSGVDLASQPSQFAVGLPFSLSLLAILGAHELGHYFAARRHGMTVTLPYFIPVPVALGTFGAFIGIHSQAPNRKALFDVAVAGPLAGLTVAVPMLWFGLQNSMVIEGAAAGNVFHSLGVNVGSSVVLALIGKLALGGALLEGHRLILHPVALAGWLGIIITALNLLPVAQLDGGYITHALLGPKRANVVSIVGLIAIFSLAFFVWSGLLMWAFVVFFVASTRDPLPVNDLTRVGPSRTVLGYFALGLLLLILFPVPASFYPVLEIHPFA